MKAPPLRAGDITAKDGIAGVIADLVWTWAGLDLLVQQMSRGARRKAW